MQKDNPNPLCGSFPQYWSTQVSYLVGDSVLYCINMAARGLPYLQGRRKQTCRQVEMNHYLEREKEEGKDSWVSEYVQLVSKKNWDKLQNNLAQ